MRCPFDAFSLMILSRVYSSVLSFICAAEAKLGGVNFRLFVSVCTAISLRGRNISIVVSIVCGVCTPRPCTPSSACVLICKYQKQPSEQTEGGQNNTHNDRNGSVVTLLYSLSCVNKRKQSKIGN